MKLLGATLITSAVLLAIVATPADAANYRALQCHERSGAAHQDATYSSSTERYQSAAVCGAAGLGIRHVAGRKATKSGRFGEWTVTAPAGVDVVRATARVAAARADGHVPQVVMGLDGGSRKPFPRVEGNRHVISWSGSGGRYLSGRLQCQNGRDCGTGQGAHLQMKRIMFTLRDAAPPTVDLGGSILGDGAQRGTETLEVAAGDSGSGVRQITVEVNGEPVATRRQECAIQKDIAVRLRPCPANPTSRFDLATTSANFRQGRNQIRVCAIDYAPRASGNRTCEAHAVRVDNECPVSSQSGTHLRARFAGSGERTTVRSNESATVRGTVRDASGNPVRDARVCVATTVTGSDGAERVIARLETNSNGQFEARVPSGPNRSVRVAHWAGSDEVHETFLRLRSKAQPRLSLSPRRTLRNGERLRFAVKLPGPSNDGRDVRIEARSDGRWVQVASGRTDRKGLWRGFYRFRHTTSTHTYGFRAVVRQQPNYPYASGKSKTKTATVTG